MWLKFSSKQNCGVVTSPKKQTKPTQNVSWVRFVRFLGEVTARQFCFKINWPLENRVSGRLSLLSVQCSVSKTTQMEKLLNARHNLGWLPWQHNNLYRKRCLTVEWLISMLRFCHRFVADDDHNCQSPSNKVLRGALFDKTEFFVKEAKMNTTLWEQIYQNF